MSLSKEQFDAILAKNEIARLLKRREGSAIEPGFIELSPSDLEYISIRMELIEKHLLPENNQPSFRDEFNSKY